MGIKVRDIVLLNRNYERVAQDLEMLKEGMRFTASEVRKTNEAMDLMEDIARVEAGEELNTDWDHVAIQSESDRNPLIKTSEPGINVETQVLLKKLDII